MSVTKPMEERHTIEIQEFLKKKPGLDRILGESKAVSRLRRQIEGIATCDVSVLISGESGTGKELAARAVHYLSSRAHMPFIPVNCGAIPDNLFENELFGHRKGAFTDAAFHQEGLVKEAEGGTLFLDEIGVINPYIQVKLLRLLQDKEYKPLGDPRARKANIRIVAASNRELQTLVEEGTFREDLFFRLNIVSLYIPPLRERSEDIPLLAEHFIKKYSREYRKPLREMSEEVTDALATYPWPGNIRELENKIQHAIVMASTSAITLKDLHLSFPVNTPPVEVNGFDCFNVARQKVINSFEKKYLTQLLEAFNGNVVNAAQKAGKSRTALWNLISKHRLSPKQFVRVQNG